MLLNSVIRNFSNASIMPKKVFFYYDVISPYSWFCFEILQRYQSYWKDVDIVLKPCFLSAIVQAAEGKPPHLSKIKYSRMDLARRTRQCDVPLREIKGVRDIIVKGSLLPMRFLTATSIHQNSYLVDATRALWMRRYNKDQDISTANDLRAIGCEVGIPEKVVESLLTSATTQDIKDVLKETTAEAISHGAFGTPTMVTEIDGKMEMFFGADHLEILAYEIGREWKGPIPPSSS